MKTIYFDNSATTKVHKEIADRIYKLMTEDFGNPSSKHFMGFNAEKLIKEAQEKIAKTLKCEANEILFTSGGTESNNTVLFGIAKTYKKQGKHIITCTIEHSAVSKPLTELEKDGYEITFIPVDVNGLVDKDTLIKAVREDTILVSLMQVNNEIGSVNDVAELAKAVKEKNPKTFFHTDAVQAYGKFKMNPKRDKIDFISVSAHKLHGPKGVGFLYMNKNVRLAPLVYGGGQQRDMRSGTLNVPGIVGMGDAAELAYKNLDENVAKIRGIKNKAVSIVEKLATDLGDIHINGKTDESSAPNILSISVKDIKSEVLLHALEDYGICVSSGSACSSNHPGLSGTLKGINLDKAYLEGTIRLSFSIYNELEEVDEFDRAMREIVPKLRKFK